MLAISQVRVLFFDVFGTCVAQRPPIVKELSNATQEALKSSTISPEVRAKAKAMTTEEWTQFMEEWNNSERSYVQSSIARDQSVDWRAVDANRLDALCRLLAQRGLIVLDDEAARPVHALEGSLWNDAQLQHLSLVWHRLDPWPDTQRGLELFNRRFPTVTLSNTYNEMLEDVKAHGDLPFTHIFSADLFGSYKPNPKVYLGGAEKMGAEPHECALIATHLYDLKAAKECGFQTIYVERPREESRPELRGEVIPDMWIKPDEGGFVEVARRLGIEDE